MKKFTRFICAVCFLLMAFSSVPVSFAYENDTEIIYSDTFDEYSDETAQSVIETQEKSNYDEQKAIENDYCTFRVVVCA